MTGFYTRKAIALDQAFVEFNPKDFKPLTLTAGKFRYPWFNTELTWDKDLNPEVGGGKFGIQAGYSRPEADCLRRISIALCRDRRDFVHRQTNRTTDYVTAGRQVQNHVGTRSAGHPECLLGLLRFPRIGCNCCGFGTCEQQESADTVHTDFFR